MTEESFASRLDNALLELERSEAEVTRLRAELDRRSTRVDMRPFVEDEVNAAWAEVNKARARVVELEEALREIAGRDEFATNTLDLVKIARAALAAAGEPDEDRPAYVWPGWIDEKGVHRTDRPGRDRFDSRLPEQETGR